MVFYLKDKNSNPWYSFSIMAYFGVVNLDKNNRSSCSLCHFTIFMINNLSKFNSCIFLSFYLTVSGVLDTHSCLMTSLPVSSFINSDILSFWRSLGENPFEKQHKIFILQFTSILFTLSSFAWLSLLVLLHQMNIHRDPKWSQ